MRIQPTHNWDLGYREAVELQAALATQIRLERLPEPTRQTDRIAGQEKRRLEAGVIDNNSNNGD